jgi:hypothetical protein
VRERRKQIREAKRFSSLEVDDVWRARSETVDPASIRGRRLHTCASSQTILARRHEQQPIALRPEATMKYKTLGNTGLLVSRLCLGTMTFSYGSGV